MGIGPVPAVERLFAKNGLSWDDIGLVELNEAFAAQVLAVMKGWNWDERDKLNVNGSGISLGHPIGATGVRIMTTLLHAMQRRDVRSEEHTSELQSLMRISYDVFCLKNKKT